MVLVVPEGWEDPAQLLADQMAAGKVASVVTGGATRAESVAAGLAEVPESADAVLVHDAARPLRLAASCVSRVLARWPMPTGRCRRCRCQTRSSAPRVSRSPRRSSATDWWRCRRRRRFGPPCLREAYDRPLGELQAATDCASLLENAGHAGGVGAG